MEDKRLKEYEVETKEVTTRIYSVRATSHSEAMRNYHDGKVIEDIYDMEYADTVRKVGEVNDRPPNDH